MIQIKYSGKLLGDLFDEEEEENAKLERASLCLSNKMTTYIKSKGSMLIIIRKIINILDFY